MRDERADARKTARAGGIRPQEERATPITIYLKQFSETPNVGDAIGSRIVEWITGRRVCTVGEDPMSVPNLIGIGSIVHWSDERSMLWGCGLIAENLAVRPPAQVLAVRGKLTRDALTARGIGCGDVLGDVGWLLPGLIAPSRSVHPVGLVPHYVDREAEFVAACRSEGIPIVDVQGSPEAYVDQLTSCRRIVSSSLHGIVIAHAYGIEAAWVQISDRVHGNGFKFFDYYSSLGLAPRDVAVLSPAQHSIGYIADTCWRPDALPDLVPLRQSLERKIVELDV